MEKKNVEIQMFSLCDLSAELQKEIADCPEHICKDGGKIYISKGSTVFCCEDGSAGNQFAFSVLQDFSAPKGRNASSAEEHYFRLLTDTGPETEDPAGRQNTPFPGNCLVILFQTGYPQEKDLLSLFSDIAPTDRNDICVPIDFCNIALIKSLGTSTEAETCEYASAVIGSMEGEGISGVRAGLGAIIRCESELRESYLQAQTALRLGKLYHENESVYPYSQMTLERILDCIPGEKRKELVSRFSELTFTDEIRETIRVFFQNDLNLTAASKQLFIHRNTLNYRLDKIKKEAGYDLRRFPDAVIYKILSDLAEGGKDSSLRSE